MSVIKLNIDGKDYSGWKSFSYNSSLTSLTPSFILDVYDLPTNNGLHSLLSIKPFRLFKLYIYTCKKDLKQYFTNINEVYPTTKKFKSNKPIPSPLEKIKL